MKELLASNEPNGGDEIIVSDRSDGVCHGGSDSLQVSMGLDQGFQETRDAKSSSWMKISLLQKVAIKVTSFVAPRSIA
jgi:hypothetical protein